MALFALSLILLASFIHAGWNLLAKRAAGGVIFVWLYSVASFVLYAPLVLYIVVTDRPEIGALGWALIVSSGVLHLLYAVTLQRGYNLADISVVYPVARGTGPLISSIGAIIMLIAGGTSILRSTDARTARGIFYGVLTGLCISAYTINDAYAVKSLHLSPIVFQYLESSIRVVALAPLALKEATFASELKRTWRLALGVGFLVPISYILVLYAMTLAPVSYVAPARELSMLIGALVGAKLFREGHVIERAIGCLLMLVGIAGLTAG